MSRLWPIAITFLVVGIATALMDLLLNLCLGQRIKHVTPPVYPTVIVRVYQRVAAFEKMQNADGLTNDHLAAVLGFSSVRDDCDPNTMAENDPFHRRWMVLGAPGRNISQLEYLSHPLLSSSLRPSLVVIGIHGFMFQNSDREPWVLPPKPIHHLRDIALLEMVQRYSWLGQNLERLDDVCNSWTVRAADRVRVAFGLPLSQWYAIDSQPFISWNESFGGTAAPEVMQIETDALKRGMTPARFSADNGQARVLAVLVDELRQQGSKLVCVLMPESSAFRRICPAVALDHFNDAVAKIAAEGLPLKVVSFREAMPDDFFFDYTHLNAEGSRRFSAMLAKRLAE